MPVKAVPPGGSAGGKEAGLEFPVSKPARPYEPFKLDGDGMTVSWVGYLLAPGCVGHLAEPILELPKMVFGSSWTSVPPQPNWFI